MRAADGPPRTVGKPCPPEPGLVLGPARHLGRRRAALRLAVAVLLLVGVFGMTNGQQGRTPKRLLAIGEVRGYQHDSVSTALGTVWRLGRESGLWDTYIRTDSQLVTKRKLTRNAKNLDDFDAVFFFTTGELDMDGSQRADLLAFVRDDGKGFVGGHSAIDTFFEWPEYGEMVGAYFDQHPWGIFDAPVIVENRTSPMTRHLPPAFRIRDEIYQPSREYSRDRLDVLMRLDERKIDLGRKGVKRADRDFAVAWARAYGKGRVFWSTFGHGEEVYDDPKIRTLYAEAIKWALRLTDYDPTPHPKPPAPAE